MELMDLVRLVDARWGRRLTNSAAYSVQRRYEGFIDHSFEVQFQLDADLIRIEASSLDPEPGSLPTLLVRPSELGATMRALDADLRVRLPRDYVDACDRRLSSSAARPLRAPEHGAVSHPAGPTVEFESLPRILSQHFGARVSDISIDSDDARSLTARLDRCLTIGIAHDAQYGAYSAAIVQKGRATGVLLGERLIARHPDEQSIRELLTLIDSWLALRVAGAFTPLT